MGQCIQDNVFEHFISGVVPERGDDILFIIVQQTGPERSPGGQSQAVALCTEMGADRCDKSHNAFGAADAKFFGGSVMFCFFTGSQQSKPGGDPLFYFSAQDLLICCDGPVSHGHVFDEPDMKGPGERQCGNVLNFMIIDSF